MTPAEKRRKIAEEKKDLVWKLLMKGETKSAARRAVKKAYGSGIATRDITLVANQVEKARTGFKDSGSVSAPRRLAALVRRIGVEDRSQLTEQEKVDLDRRLKLDLQQPKAKQTAMRRFLLDRSFDATGTSGTGIVAEGIQFSSGHVVIHWLSQLEAINVYGNARVLEQLHGHNGSTEIVWVDEAGA